MIKKWAILLFLINSLFVTLAFAAPKAILLEVNGAISPATQDYIERGIQYTAEQNAEAVIINLNTPGGLETSMRGITEAIIASPVPIITYVYPSGARAASAGLFLMYASHISAMAPGTNLGAASPVNIMPREKPLEIKGVPETSTQENKAMNDAAAYIRSLAQLRGRNLEFAELAVRKAASLSASEALAQNVIDMIALNHDELLQKANGKKVIVQNKAQTLQTTQWQLEPKPQDWRYQFLAFITNPNIAYILMLIAIYGIFFELYNPGLILPGVAGVIALLLALYAFQLLPVNYTGLFLILLGIVFMIMEAYVTTYGIIGIGGAIAFIIGSIMLFDIRDGYFQLSWSIVVIMSILTIGFIFLMLYLVMQAHRKKIVSGQEGLINAEGEVIRLSDDQCLVRVSGELWTAKTTDAVQVGDKSKVSNVKGLTLLVKPSHKKTFSGEN